MDAYELILPWPPSNNHYKGFVSKPKISKRTGRPLKCFFIPADTKQFHTDVVYRFLTQKGIQMRDKTIRVEIYAYPPDNRRRDLDNLPKVVLDALQKAGAYFDDSQIDYLLIERKEKFPRGMLKVRISEI